MRDARIRRVALWIGNERARGVHDARRRDGDVRGVRLSDPGAAPVATLPGSQCTARPVPRATERAISSSDTSRTASRSNCEASGSRNAKLATPEAMAISATTSSSSIKVKPRQPLVAGTRSAAPAA